MEFVTPYYKLHLIHADEDDNKFVDCAFAAGASCIVSNDAHFKTLNEIKFPRIFCGEEVDALFLPCDYVRHFEDGMDAEVTKTSQAVA